MNEALEAAIKEAYATAPSNVVYLDTIEISHPDIDSIFLVRDRKDWELVLEDEVDPTTFEACAFNFQRPQSGQAGLQELTLQIDNVDRRITDFINTVKNSTEPVEIYFRPYLASDVTAPQMDPPLVLVLKDIVMTPAGGASGRASFADLINKPFLTSTYTRARFPGLGN